MPNSPPKRCNQTSENRNCSNILWRCLLADLALGANRSGQFQIGSGAEVRSDEARFEPAPQHHETLSDQGQDHVGTQPQER